ncbi:MAG: aspartate-semialdehyde dehydrogenase [Phycisphaerales bacterium]
MPRDRLIAVVGATGPVGREVLNILKDRGVAPERLRLFASDRSAGAIAQYGVHALPVAALGHGCFTGTSVAFFCASAEVALRHAFEAAEAGALVIDNSSGLRMHPGVPLVVPEINGHLVGDAPGGRVIANPNCSTAIMLTALHPFRERFGIEAIDVATYQAVSGAGQKGIDELLTQAEAHALGRLSPPSAFPEPCLFNVFSHDAPVDAGTGVNGEEQKMIEESRKIWEDAALRITPTCVRVPVLRAHTQAITVTLLRPATEDALRDAWQASSSLHIIDDRAHNRFPTPAKASGMDSVLVGRLRPDPCAPPDSGGARRRWCLLACGDQLRKGAALNAVQVADAAHRTPLWGCTADDGSVRTSPLHRAVEGPPRSTVQDRGPGGRRSCPGHIPA